MKKILMFCLLSLSQITYAQNYGGSISFGSGRIIDGGRGAVGVRVDLPIGNTTTNTYRHNSYGNTTVCTGYGANRHCSGSGDNWRNPEYNHGYVDGFIHGNRYPNRRPVLRERIYNNRYNNADGCVGLYANPLKCENSRRALDERYDN